MSTSGSGTLTGSKAAGLALMVGVILSIVASLLYPGGVLIDPVDQTDFPKAIEVMSDNASLTHAMTLAMILAMLLEAFGALALFRLLGRQESLADAALRFGLVGIVFNWGVFIVQLGTRHMVVHITQHGIGSGTAQEMQAQLQDFAVAVYSAGGALHVAVPVRLFGCLCAPGTWPPVPIRCNEHLQGGRIRARSCRGVESGEPPHSPAHP